MRMRWSALALLVASVSCRDALPPLTEGHAVGYYQGQSWIANASAIVVHHAGAPDSLAVWVNRPGSAVRGGVDEDLAFRVKLNGVGSHESAKQRASFHLVVGGDGVVASFVGASDPAGTLELL